MSERFQVVSEIFGVPVFLRWEKGEKTVAGGVLLKGRVIFMATPLERWILALAVHGHFYHLLIY